jgi:hypothetical protein
VIAEKVAAHGADGATSIAEQVGSRHDNFQQMILVLLFPQATVALTGVTS